jgi:hypothetical protein
MLSASAAAGTVNAIGIPLLRRAESADLTKLRSTAGKIDPTGEVEYLRSADLLCFPSQNFSYLLNGVWRDLSPG